MFAFASVIFELERRKPVATHKFHSNHHRSKFHSFRATETTACLRIDCCLFHRTPETHRLCLVTMATLRSPIHQNSVPLAYCVRFSITRRFVSFAQPTIAEFDTILRWKILREYYFTVGIDVAKTTEAILENRKMKRNYCAFGLENGSKCFFFILLFVFLFDCRLNDGNRQQCFSLSLYLRLCAFLIKFFVSFDLYVFLEDTVSRHIYSQRLMHIYNFTPTHFNIVLARSFSSWFGNRCSLIFGFWPRIVFSAHFSFVHIQFELKWWYSIWRMAGLFWHPATRRMPPPPPWLFGSISFNSFLFFAFVQ